MQDRESVLVIGGSIAGLATALALEHSGREVVIVERDPAPPELAPDQAFERWDRTSVPQFRHTHILLARLHTVIRDRHPALLAELEQAGLTPSAVDQMLPPAHVDSYRALPGDEDLLHLWGRRATFEYVLRRHVGRLAHVRFVHEARVEDLVVEPEPAGGALRVSGLEVALASGRETLRGALVVDASGARTKAAEWLAARGVRVQTERHESPYAYFCRHYRLRDPSDEPPRRGTGANLDYLWYGLFSAEHGHFSIAVACPEAEKALLETVRRPEGFDFTCQRLPALAPWLSRAEPVSKVLGAGKLANRWTRYGGQGGPALLGYFAVGDAQMQTNPMYGRGCSSAFVQAQVLAEALARHADPAQRSAHYYRQTWAALRPHFDSSIGADRLFLSRAKQQRGEPIALVDRVLSYLYDEAWMPALDASLFVAREMVKAMQMRELSPLSARFAVLGHVLWAFFVGRFRRARSAPSAYGPTRAELLRELPAANDP